MKKNANPFTLFLTGLLTVCLFLSCAVFADEAEEIRTEPVRPENVISEDGIPGESKDIANEDEVSGESKGIANEDKVSGEGIISESGDFSDGAVYKDADLITKQPEAQPYYVLGQKAGQVPQYRVETVLKDGCETEYSWFLDNKRVGTDSPVLTLDDFRNYPAGVYDIFCTVSMKDDQNVVYTDTSMHVNFIVCKGVIPNSFLTFSDVHKAFRNIGRAIEEVMSENENRIPALIVCTGDWTNVHPSAGAGSTRKKYMPALKNQSGGIDTVYVAGNHENSVPADEYNEAAGLGYDGSGLIFDGDAAPFAESSAADKGLRVFGINFSDIYLKDESGNYYYSYENVIPRLRAFLKRMKNDPAKELILISSHTGLHVLGIQPESTASKWRGRYKNNIDGSFEMVRLINEYADKYDMNILFMFGHNHSKGETEFFLPTGSTITSTIEYDKKLCGSQKILFSYMHAGYLSTRSGSTKHYSFMTWDSSGIRREFAKLGGRREFNEIRYGPVITNPLKVSPSSVKYKRTSLSKAVYFQIGVSGAKGRVTYTPDAKSKKAGFKVSSKGRVTVPKKCGKGVYRITVRAAGSSFYKPGKKTVKITVT